MKHLLLALIPATVLATAHATTANAQSRHGIETDKLSRSYHYAWSMCANCGPSRRGLHLYISPVLFVGGYEHAALEGPFFNVARTMRGAKPNAIRSNGYIEREYAVRARQSFVSRLRSRGYQVHYVTWSTSRAGYHGRSRRIDARPSRTSYRTRNRYRPKRHYRTNRYRTPTKRYRAKRYRTKRYRTKHTNRYRTPTKRYRTKRYRTRTYRTYQPVRLPKRRVTIQRGWR